MRRERGVKKRVKVKGVGNKWRIMIKKTNKKNEKGCRKKRGNR